MAKLQRPHSTGLDTILGDELKPQGAGGGFVRVVDYMGSDSAIVEAARVSYGEGTTWVSKDESLLRYLMRHNHSTPFEMCEIKFHIKMPIFVARQLMRHRTASVNEVSARYSVVNDEFYIPDADKVKLQSKSNKQGSEGEFSVEDTARIRKAMQESTDTAYALYYDLLEEGLARETARGLLPTSTFTEIYWKIDLRNLLHFLNLRLAKNAQPEIRGYARTFAHCVREWVPMTYGAWKNYNLLAHTFSQHEHGVIVKALRGEPIVKAEHPLSEREWQELDEKLNANAKMPFSLTFAEPE